MVVSNTTAKCQTRLNPSYLRLGTEKNLQFYLTYTSWIYKINILILNFSEAPYTSLLWKHGKVPGRYHYLISVSYLITLTLSFLAKPVNTGFSATVSKIVQSTPCLFSSKKWLIQLIMFKRDLCSTQSNIRRARKKKKKKRPDGTKPCHCGARQV